MPKYRQRQDENRRAGRAEHLDAVCDEDRKRIAAHHAKQKTGQRPVAQVREFDTAQKAMIKQLQSNKGSVPLIRVIRNAEVSVDRVIANLRQLRPVVSVRAPSLARAEAIYTRLRETGLTSAAAKKAFLAEADKLATREKTMRRGGLRVATAKVTLNQAAFRQTQPVRPRRDKSQSAYIVGNIHSEAAPI